MEIKQGKYTPDIVLWPLGRNQEMVPALNLIAVFTCQSLNQCNLYFLSFFFVNSIKRVLTTLLCHSRLHTMTVPSKCKFVRFYMLH